jgi:hypothetical protein
MQLWYPPNDQPHLLEWWRPLMLASQAVRRAHVPWPIHLDEFVLVGRIERSGRPDIWVYRHGTGQGELYLDGTGKPYAFTPTPKAKSLGRFAECDIRKAIWRARLPDVVEPIWYRSEQRPRYDDEWDGDTAAEEDLAPQPRQHGHLTVHDGGRTMAG